MSDICGDNRFEIIAEAKSDLLEATNIKDSPEEMAVLDNVLFRCWQMGWLNKYELNEFEWCTDCKEYDQEKHCCHRWTKVIRQVHPQGVFAGCRRIKKPRALCTGF